MEHNSQTKSQIYSDDNFPDGLDESFGAATMEELAKQTGAERTNARQANLSHEAKSNPMESSPDSETIPVASATLESTSEDEARSQAMRESLNQYGLESTDWELLDQELEGSDFFEPAATKPVVAIVGRPNVGKSTLVNRILGRREAVVQDVPGVTRDRVRYDASWNGTDFVLVDTGGWEVDTRGLDKHVAEQSELAVQMADVVVMVVDATVGITATDERALEMLRRSKKPVILAANKVDSTSQEADAAYLWSLGLGEPHPVSALHGRGTGDLLDAVLLKVSENESVGIERRPSGVRRVALVGRPNVGKSSLLNALAGQNRAVVHDLAGTTRDPVDEIIELDGERWLFVDTAGVKRKLHRTSGADYYATLRTAAQIEQAEVALVLVDASVPMVDQDLRVMQQVIDAGRALVIVNNKWDLVDAQRQTDLRREQSKELERVTWAPRINLSALTTWHTNRISRALHQALAGWDTRIPTARLNSFLGKLVAAHPHPVRGGKQSRILFATQAAARPPRFVLFTTGFLEAPYLRFIERRLREEFGFVGTPIQFSVRIRERKRR